MRKNDPDKSITYYVVFGGYSNVQLGGDILKFNYPKLTVMLGYE